MELDLHKARSRSIFLCVLHSIMRYCLCVCVLSAYPSIEFAELGLHRGEKQVHLSQCISLGVRYCLWVFVYVLSAYPFIEFMELGLHRGEEENS